MKHYSISVEAKGQGDYGSDFLTVVDRRPCTRKSAIEAANRIAVEHNSRVLVFVGKTIGKLVYDSREAK